MEKHSNHRPVACQCTPNSPFRWAERERQDSFAVALQKGKARAKLMTAHVNAERARGHDIGHIHGLGDRAPRHDRHRPQRFVTGPKTRETA